MPTNHEPVDSASQNASPTDAHPLKGQTVLVTRSKEQAGELCKRLEALGADTIVHPVIQVLPMDNLGQIDDVISRIATFDWIVFVSANGVRFFLDRLAHTDGLLESFRRKKFATIGSSTLSQLKKIAGVEANLIPAHANSEALAESLIEAAIDQRVLVIRASRGSKTLAGRLNRAGLKFEEVAAYQSVDIDSADPLAIEQIRAQQVDWVTITSSAIARSTIRLFGEGLRNTKTVSISPTTSAAMIELGSKPDAEARTYSMDGIVDAIVKHSNLR